MLVGVINLRPLPVGLLHIIVGSFRGQMQKRIEVAVGRAIALPLHGLHDHLLRWGRGMGTLKELSGSVFDQGGLKRERM